MKSTLHNTIYRTESPKFSSAHLSVRSAIFQDFTHFRTFPLTTVLKFQKNTRNFWHIAKTFISLYFPMTILFIIKFGSDRIKTVGVAF